jgi:hypothetical protein
MRCSLRSTVDATHPRRAAIAALVSPSIELRGPARDRTFGVHRCGYLRPRGTTGADALTIGPRPPECKHNLLNQTEQYVASISAAQNSAPIDIPVGPAAPARPTQDRFRTEPVGGGRPTPQKNRDRVAGFFAAPASYLVSVGRRHDRRVASGPASRLEGVPTMDATRARRTRDRARQAWYARHRQWRFARFLGFGGGTELLPRLYAMPRRTAVGA